MSYLPIINQDQNVWRKGQIFRYCLECCRDQYFIMCIIVSTTTLLSRWLAFNVSPLWRSKGLMFARIIIFTLSRYFDDHWSKRLSGYLYRDNDIPRNRIFHLLISIAWKVVDYFSKKRILVLVLYYKVHFCSMMTQNCMGILCNVVEYLLRPGTILSLY